ncbi:MAG: gluconeogenesis factor YvcK family protein [Anaerolineae bacterium]
MKGVKSFLEGWLSTKWFALLLAGAGCGAVVLAARHLRSQALGQAGPKEIEVVHRRQSGPKVVAIGGGHGLSTLLRGLKEYTSQISAIVTVADDGGSSGRLRRALGVLPPGDFRNCIAALADDESLMAQLFQYRFGEGMALEGHSFGNLFIVAMAAITGSFERAILESGRVLAVQGSILPSTLEDVTLCADLRSEGEDVEGLQRVEGESQIPDAGLPIERVYLRPSQVRAYPGALRAILEADLIAIGPGSLYTSILPNLLVEDIVRAIRASPAVKVYICNVATQAGETEGFSLRDHIEALERHVGKGLFRFALANDRFDVPLPPGWKDELVRLIPPDGEDYQLVTADLIDPEKPWRHDPKKLARALLDLYHPVKSNPPAGESQER